MEDRAVEKRNTPRARGLDSKQILQKTLVTKALDIKQMESLLTEL